MLFFPTQEVPLTDYPFSFALAQLSTAVSVHAFATPSHPHSLAAPFHTALMSSHLTASPSLPFLSSLPPAPTSSLPHRQVGQQVHVTVDESDVPPQVGREGPLVVLDVAAKPGILTHAPSQDVEEERLPRTFWPGG